MKRILLLSILFLMISLPSYGDHRFNNVREYDWYRVINGFSASGVWCPFSIFTARPGDKIYCYWVRDYEIDIYLFDSKGKKRGWYWVANLQEMERIANGNYCTFLENREDKRYK